MKRIAFALVALMMGAATVTVQAQTAQELIKERKALAKASREELNQKASKDARKDAKKFRKEGWQVVPGALPLEKQLDKSYMMQYEYDEDMFPKYIMGEAMSIGENYDAAKMQALELAKQNLAGQIQTEATALIDNTLGNDQTAPEEAASITRSAMAAKNLISQNIGRTITVVELYKTLGNKNKQVLVRIAYNSEMAKAAAKKAIRQDLEQRGDNLHEKLDELLGW